MLIAMETTISAYNYRSKAVKVNSGVVWFRVWRYEPRYWIDFKKARLRRLRESYSIAFSILTYLVVHHRLRVFITLTLRDNSEDWRKGIKRVRSYLHRLGCKGAFWVKEVQKRGVIHFHLLVDKYVPKEDLARVWRCGFVDVRLAYDPFYVGKYLGKAFDVDVPVLKGLRRWGVWFVKVERESYFLADFETVYAEFYDQLLHQARLVGLRVIWREGFVFAFVLYGLALDAAEGYGHLLYPNGFG